VEEVLKLSEIAALMKTAPSTPWRWVKRGLLPAMQTPTGLIRVRRIDFLKFIAGGASRKEEISNN